MCAPAFTLAPFEVAVRRRRAAFLGPQPIIVHGQAHGASRLTPLEAGLDEVLVDALLFGQALHDA